MGSLLRYEKAEVVTEMCVKWSIVPAIRPLQLSQLAESYKTKLQCNK